MPYSIIAIGLLTTLFVGGRSLQPQPIDITIQKPTFNSIPDIATDFRNLFAGLQMAIQDLLQFSSSLTSNVPIFISSITNLFVQILIIFGHGIALVLQTIGAIIYIIWAGTTNFLSVIFHLGIAILNAILIALGKLISQLISLISFVFISLSHIALATWDQLLHFTSQIWYILMTPFRVIIAGYLKIKPYLDYIVNNVKDSMSFLMTGVDTVNDIVNK